MKLKRLFYYGAITVLGLAIPILYFMFGFREYSAFDPYYYVHLGLNILDGNVYKTKVITPLSWSIHSTLEGHPELWKPPLYPLLIAFSFLLLGEYSFLPVLISSFFFLLSGLILHRITELLFDSEAGFWASLFFMTAPPMILFGIRALTESLYIMLVLTGILVVLWKEDHPFILGVIFALAYLTRFNHWFMMSGTLFFALAEADMLKKRYFFLVMTSFLIILSPWMTRNVILTGNPFFHLQIFELISHTSEIPYLDIFLYFNPPNVVDYLVSNIFTIMNKGSTNILSIINLIPRLFEEIWLVACLAAFYLGSASFARNRQAKYLLGGFSIAFLLQALILAFVVYHRRYFLIFLPIIFIFGGKGVQLLLNRKKLLAITIGGLGVLFSFSHIIKENPSIDLTVKDYVDLTKYVPENEPIVTDLPELTALYANRYSLLMAPFKEAEEKYPEFNFVYKVNELNRFFAPSVSFDEYYRKNPTFNDEFSLLKHFRSSGNKLYVRSSYKSSISRNELN